VVNQTFGCCVVVTVFANSGQEPSLSGWLQVPLQIEHRCSTKACCIVLDLTAMLQLHTRLQQQSQVKPHALATNSSYIISCDDHHVMACSVDAAASVQQACKRPLGVTQSCSCSDHTTVVCHQIINQSINQCYICSNEISWRIITQSVNQSVDVISQ
jgi:hypothetical protein